MREDGDAAARSWTVARVDVHTHVGRLGQHVGAPLADHEIAAWGSSAWDVDIATFVQPTQDVGTRIVLAFDAEPVGVHVPNEYVGEVVAAREDLIGFASVNPNRHDAIERLHEAVSAHGLQGLKLGPTYQHFHAHSPESVKLVGEAASLGLPIIWHQGTTFTRAAIGEYAPPLDLDLIARRFPETPMWIAHMGHPWMAEAVSVVRRHPRMFIDVSALDSRPWQLAQALASAHEYRVMDRLLFGSDFPFSTPEMTRAGLLRAVELCRTLGIAPLGDDVVDQICERDALHLLGIRKD